ncbi:hypothetical protein ACF052_33205 [Streptomyces pilosus]|uniref:hypothetical protein n=1 Tax=Streptomyces pilosus TaxID=28893 RepID=UPI0036FE7B26
MAQVLGPDGAVVGAGFLVAEALVVTCAHIVTAAGAGPGQFGRYSFTARHLATGALRSLPTPRHWNSTTKTA